MTDINKELNPNSGVVVKEENPAFTKEQIEEYGLEPKQEEQAQEPELILGKFKNTEALQEAYKELEKKFHEKSRAIHCNRPVHPALRRFSFAHCHLPSGQRREHHARILLLHTPSRKSNSADIRAAS